MSANVSVSPSIAGTLRRQPSLSRSGAMVLLIRVLGAGCILLSYIVLARSLGVTGFGEYAQAVTWLQVLGVFGKLGMDNASLRYVSEYVTKSETGKLNGFIRDTTRAAILSSTLIMVSVIVVALTNWHFIGDRLATCLILAAVMLPLVSLRQIQEASLRGIGRFMHSQISSVVWPFVLFTLALFIWQTSSTGISSPVATFLHLISVVAVSVMVYRFVRQSQLHVTGESRRETCRKQWTDTALAFFTAELLIVLKTRICVAMAGALLGRDSAGLYAAMERFADVSVLGSQSLGLVIAPQFAALFAARKFPEMRKLMWQGQLLGLGFTLPVALAVTFFRDYVFLLLGPDYREGWNALMALLVSACVTAFAGPSAYVLQMTGRERTMLAITATCAVSNVLLSLLLMPGFGILGLGISQIVTSLVWTVGLRLCLRNHPAWQNPSTAPNLIPSMVARKEAA